MLGKPAAIFRWDPANLISPQYFAALRIPLLQGRIWSDVENSKGAHVAVINRHLGAALLSEWRCHRALAEIAGNRRQSGYGVVAAKNRVLPGCRLWASSSDARNDGLRSAA